ncbi:ATP-dependent Clp protease proteolytic subunit-related protein 2, chloroplastic isoform X1 [Nicotiana tabacum]|uniref:ATP-dependent Clp protease proteolytic subunit-related protein 2, chloroplastic isoform X1 n=1 Tax=Nicotiana tabacum TaxID=4097 RepID=A0AC58TXY7_TOBAC
MAVTFPTTSSSYLHSRTKVPQPSLSCASKVFVGLRSQSPNSYGIAASNVNVEFHNRVYRSIESGVHNSRTRDSKPTRARVSMMPIGTPRVPYRNPTEGTWQWVDLWNALYRERVIFIGQHIDEEFSNQILATMLYLDSIDDSKKLYLYINGPGGDLTPSMAIYDTMQSLKSAVGTHCVGYAYNLAGFLLAAGEKGNRFAMPLSRIALQSPAGAARGQADDIRNEADELLRIRDYLFKELAEKTGQPVEKVHKDLSRMKRFNAQEALEYGLIDRIVRPPRIKADAPRKDTTAGLG